VAVATGLAVILTGRHISDGPWVLAVPVVSILALGLFRAGTGGAGSLFGILVLLPIGWIASLPGFRHVLIVAALTILAIAVPYFTEPVPSHASWLRVAVVPVTYTVMAAIVNELSRIARVRTA